MPSPQLALTHRVVPARAGAAPHPALLILHGRGADERDLLPIVEALDPRLFVVSVRAPFSLFPGYHWYELLQLGKPEPKSFGESLTRLDRFVEEIAAAYPIDPRRLFALGFSQGAMMVGTATLRDPKRFAGTIMLSGYLPLDDPVARGELRLQGQPFFVAHGQYDGILPVEAGRAARDFLRAAGADVTYHEYPMDHRVALEEIQDLAAWLRPRIEGGANAGERAASDGE